MICDKCGTQIPDEARFCPECGATVEPVAQPTVAAEETVVAAPAEAPQKNGLAIGALICSFIVPLVGLILGIVSLKKTKAKKGMAIAAIIISVVIMLTGIISTIAVVGAVNSALKEEGYSLSDLVEAAQSGPVVVEDAPVLETDPGLDAILADLGTEPEAVPSLGSVSVLENTVLVDTDEFTITILGNESNAYYNYGLKFRLENKTEDKTLMFSVNDVELEGWMIDPFWACSVKPGETEESTMGWTDLERYPFAIPAYVTMRWTVYNNDDWNEPYLLDGSFTLYPLGEGEKPTAFETPGVINLVDHAEFQINAVNVYWDDIFGYVFEMYLENKSDAPITFTAVESYLSDKECESYWSDSLPAHTQCYTKVCWYEQSLTEAGFTDLSEITSVVLNVNVYDSNTYDTLFQDYIGVTLNN